MLCYSRGSVFSGRRAAIAREAEQPPGGALEIVCPRWEVTNNSNRSSPPLVTLHLGGATLNVSYEFTLSGMHRMRQVHVLIIAPWVHGPAGAPGSTRTISRSAARPPAPAACPAQLGNYEVVGPFVSIRDAITPHRLAIPVKLKRDEKARPPHPHSRAPRQTQAPVPSEDDDGGARTSEGEGGGMPPHQTCVPLSHRTRLAPPPLCPPSDHRWSARSARPKGATPLVS